MGTFLNIAILFCALSLFGLKPEHIIIGDSQAPSIAYHSKLAVVEKTLQKGGWRVSDLMTALQSYPVNNAVKNVFVCIGTNGMFSQSDDVSGLCKLLKEKFPSANLYVIPGSYGWSWKGPYTPSASISVQIKSYYDMFEMCGVHTLDNGIGLSSEHPDINTPSMKLIANEIDSIIQSK